MIRHRTKEGIEMNINQMENDHLINTIKMFVKNLQSARDTMERGAGGFYEKANDIHVDIEKANTFVRGFHQMFSPYILEALIRDLDVSEQVKEYQTIIERKTAVPFNKTTLQIGAREMDDDDFYEEEF